MEGTMPIIEQASVESVRQLAHILSGDPRKYDQSLPAAELLSQFDAMIRFDKA